MGVIDLDPTRLGDRNNVAIVFATPAGGTGKLFENAQAGRRWLTLRTSTPAAPWERSLFNGHAQTILQSTGAVGRVTLRARAEGLAPASLTIDTF